MNFGLGFFVCLCVQKEAEVHFGGDKAVNLPWHPQLESVLKDWDRLCPKRQSNININKLSIKFDLKRGGTLPSS